MTGSGADPSLAALIDVLTDRIHAGEPIDFESIVARHPEHAEQLRRLLPALEMMGELKNLAVRDAAAPRATGRDLRLEGGVLGDFRLVREVGRGGMGVVYEAVEVSLNRRVALKILHGVAALDARQLHRFRIEAQSLASLNHTNIVPIYSVGRDPDIPYYAMQLIEGQTLAEVIRELQLGGRPVLAGWDVKENTEALTSAEVRFPPESEISPSLAKTELGPQDSPSPRTDPTSSAPSNSAPRDRDFFRMVAELGRQAAAALAHAHGLGILHRDIKPANLLVDARGHLWVTDFGLAQLHGDRELTRSGDLIGTVRYMSPEQAAGGRAVIDHRTDIYSLGVTLYELVTLCSPFHDKDGAELLRRVTREEPCPLRRLNPATPRDLETIVAKAMEKDPTSRYATAEAMAEDLERFLGGRSILARRPSTLDRSAKWVRRHRPFVATVAALTCLLVAVVLAAMSWSNGRLRSYVEQLQAEKARTDALADESKRLRQIAEKRQRLADRNSYGTRVRLASEALGQGHVEHAQEILGEVQPTSGDQDPRDFAWHYLLRQARREVVRYGGHEAPVGTFALSPVENLIACGDDSGAILLRGPDMDLPPHRLTGHTLPITVLAFSPDGRWLVSAAVPREPRIQSELRLWDVRSRRAIAVLEGYAHRRIDSVAFVGGGRRLAAVSHPTAGVPAELWFHDLAPGTGEPSPGCRLGVESVAVFSPDGSALAARRSIDRHEIIDAVTGATRWSVQGSGTAFDLPVFSGDGRWLAALNETGVLVWDAKDGHVRRHLPRYAGIARALNLSPDGSTLAVTNPAGEVILHDLVADRERLSRPIIPDDFTRERNTLVVFSPDGSKLALSGQGNPGGQAPVTLWDVADGRRLGTYPGRCQPLNCLAFSPDGRSLFLNGKNAVQRWICNRLGDEQAEAPIGHLDEAWAVAFSHDGRILASGSDDSEDDDTIKLWDVASGRLLRSWWGHTEGTVAALAFSPDGRTLASVGLESTENVRLWDLAKGALRFTLAGHTDRVRTVAFTPDGSQMATAGNDGTIRLWDPSTGSAVRVLSGHNNKIRRVAFSPDGRTLASAANDRTVRLWDTSTGRLRHVLRGPDHFVAVAFSPDGKTVAAADENGPFWLWDAKTGMHLKTTHADEGGLICLTYAPDGRTLALGGASRKIRIWDLASDQELLTLEGHSEQINSLAFSPDGMTLASCDHGGAVKLWRATPMPDDECPARPIAVDPCGKGNKLASPAAGTPPVDGGQASQYGRSSRRFRTLPRHAHPARSAPVTRSVVPPGQLRPRSPPSLAVSP